MQMMSDLVKHRIYFLYFSIVIVYYHFVWFNKDVSDYGIELDKKNLKTLPFSPTTQAAEFTCAECFVGGRES